MARRSTPLPPTSASLSKEQMRQGIERLNRRIAELEAFQPTLETRRWAPETKALEASIDDTLVRIFGSGTVEYNRYVSATNLDRGPLVVHMDGSRDSPHEIQRWLSEGRANSLALLKQAVRTLEEEIGTLDSGRALEPRTVPFGTDIFVVHGRNEQAKAEVARLLERAGLNAVILHEQPNSGRTIIEKFEAHGGTAGFAVALLTPDDVGGLAPDGALKHRARQNVIGEMFWFAGRLGRSRVCALVMGDIELPSDFVGVAYTHMDALGAWRMALLRELTAAGYSIDWQKALT